MPPKKRAQWSSESLNAAVTAIEQGMKIKRASINFGIPRGTLQRHAKTGNKVKRLGRKPVLSREQEDELCSRIFRLAKIGMPLTSKVLRRSVYTFCCTNKIQWPTNKQNLPLVGRKWLKLFLKRHPEVSRRKSQNVNPARAAKLNKFIVEHYFETLKKVMTELDLMDKPHLIFNMDEKGCQLTVHKEPIILTRKGIKRVPFVAPEHAENVTVVSCGNALGQVIPPVILFKGKRNKPEFSDNLPPGAKVFMTQKGSMTCATFVEWVRHFAQHKPPGKVLLIFDGAKSHLDANIVTAADEANITLFCLPSNCTHELQPMDKSVFRSFEYHWDDELQRFWGVHPDRKLSKSSFGIVFSKVWPKAITPSNVAAGFRATGIYPFDPTVIPESAFAPSTLSRRPQEDSEKNIANRPVVTPTKPSTSRQHQDASSTDEDSDWEGSSSSISSPAHFTPEESSDNSDDNHSQSFSELLPTPDLPAKSTARNPAKKAINYKAVKVTKALFSNDETATAKPKSQSKKKNSTPRSALSNHNESWYCVLCNEDRQIDMRQCTLCATWIHEECCGLTSKDKVKNFKCPSCEA